MGNVVSQVINIKNIGMSYTKKDSERRTVKINLRLTPLENQQLLQAFKASGHKKQSHYMREQLLGESKGVDKKLHHKAVIAIGEFSNVLNKVGVNFNQLVHAVHKYKVINFTERDNRIMVALEYVIKKAQEKLNKIE